MLHLRTLFLITLATLLLAACGGSESDIAGTGSNGTATGSTMAKAMGTTTVGSWKVTSTELALLPGGASASARAINDAGKAVGMATDASGMPQRVLWDLTSLAVVGQLPNYDPSSYAEPASMNDAGEVAGTERISSTLREGVYWALGATGYTAIGLRPLNQGSWSQITARGINKNGLIVGSSKDGATLQVNAVIWNRNASPTSLGLIGEAFGINDLGHVVAVAPNASNPSLSRGFLWRDGKAIDLGAAGGSGASARALAINNTGKIAGTSDADTLAVVWSYDPTSASSTPSLAKLPLTSDLVLPSPAAINDNGDVVGSAWTSSYAGTRAVLWRNGQVIQLATFNSKAYGINNAGQIVGEGDLNGDGRVEALLWTVGGGTTTNDPPPPPPPPPPGPTNTAPTVSIASVSPSTLNVGGTLRLQASFADPDQGQWTYTIDWGDGSSFSGVMAAPGTISQSHTYLTASPKRGYTIRVTVRDAAGATGSAAKGGVKVR